MSVVYSRMEHYKAGYPIQKNGIFCAEDLGKQIVSHISHAEKTAKKPVDEWDNNTDFRLFRDAWVEVLRNEGSMDLGAARTLVREAFQSQAGEALKNELISVTEDVAASNAESFIVIPGSPPKRMGIERLASELFKARNRPAQKELDKATNAYAEFQKAQSGIGRFLSFTSRLEGKRLDQAVNLAMANVAQEDKYIEVLSYELSNLIHKCSQKNGVNHASLKDIERILSDQRIVISGDLVGMKDIIVENISRSRAPISEPVHELEVSMRLS
jgi:hypothetical protein